MTDCYSAATQEADEDRQQRRQFILGDGILSVTGRDTHSDGVELLVYGTPAGRHYTLTADVTMESGTNKLKVIINNGKFTINGLHF